MLFLRLILFACLLILTAAHESCCKHKLQQQELVSELMEDPDEIPPAVFLGHPRYIPDPGDFRPEDWDDEDDGMWEPVLIENPEYNDTWQRRLVPNPNYIPPPTYWEKLQTEVSAAIPWVTLGVLVTGILGILSLSLGTLREWLSQTGPWSALSAALLGLATPLCSCGALPLAAGLVSHGGVPLSAVVTFLTASQSAGLDSAAITWGLLGPTAVLCRLGGAIILAIAAGMMCPHPASNSNTKGSSSKAAAAAVLGVPKSQPGLVATVLATATEIFPTVLAGLTMSTAALHFLPLLIHFEESAHNSLLVRLGILGSAIPLQLCEHTTVALAATIQKAGGSPGLAFAFLLSAPATNLPSLLLLMQHGGIQTVARVIVALSTTALALSYLVDAAEVDLLAGHEAGDMATLPEWYVSASPYLAGGLFMAGLMQRHHRRRRSTANDHDDCCSEKPKKD
jgi:uncharacterized membrane protein YraQ (UPF0718 family)